MSEEAGCLDVWPTGASFSSGAFTLRSGATSGGAMDEQTLYFFSNQKCFFVLKTVSIRKIFWLAWGKPEIREGCWSRGLIVKRTP